MQQATIVTSIGVLFKALGPILFLMWQFVFKEHFYSITYDLNKIPYWKHLKSFAMYSTRLFHAYRVLISCFMAPPQQYRRNKPTRSGRGPTARPKNKGLFIPNCNNSDWIIWIKKCKRDSLDWFNSKINSWFASDYLRNWRKRQQLTRVFLLAWLKQFVTWDWIHKRAEYLEWIKLIE